MPSAHVAIPGPNPAWARQLRPHDDPDAALAALWQDIAPACRLDAPDPAAAWRERFAALRAHADALTALPLDRLTLTGPGTARTVGLLHSARWAHAGNVTGRGIAHAWNVPSEEVFTVPDPARVDGRVALTRPVTVGGRAIEDVSLAFAAGRVVEIAGANGVEALRAYVARDHGAAVDRAGRELPILRGGEWALPAGTG